ncbi:restriction endonuclease subunit S [Colwelliaceae bacterium 6441]
MTEWKTEKLGDVCEMIKRGIAPKYIEEGGICVINQKCVRDHLINYSLARRHNLELKKVNEERYIQLGDVLVNSTGTGTLGRVAQVRNLPSQPLTVDTHVTIVRPIKGKFYNEFFGYMLIKIEKEIAESGEGASGQTELARTKLENEFSVSYPESIDEQKCIVTILDKVFIDLDKARASAEKNLENAKELFESYLHQAYSNNNFNEEALGDIVDILTDYHANGSYKILKEHVELKDTEDYAWMVRSTDFEKQFKNDKRYISESSYNYLKKTPLYGGEIIMSKIGNAGKVYYMPKVDRPCSLAMNLFLIRLNPKKAVNEYIFRYLNSVSGKAQIKPLLNGAATQTITKDSVRSLKIRLPSIDEQKEVVKKLNEMERQVQSLKQIYQNKILAIDELKKSILQKAFTGELTKSKGVAA